MDADSSQHLLILILLLAVAAFFSASETALISLSKMRLRNMVDEGIKNANLIKAVLDKPDQLLTSILIGSNLANVSVSALMTVAATERFGSSAIGIVMGILTLLLLVFGEIIPKTFAAQHAEKTSLLVIKPIYACVYIMTPLVFILNLITGSIVKIFGKASERTQLITESEFKTMVDVSHEEGVLEIDEREMINNVVDFGNSNAKDVMIPRTDIIAISADATFDEVRQMFKEEQFSRVPVYNKTMDDIVGVLSVKDYMFLAQDEDFNVTDYMREPLFTYESKPSAELFSQMRKKRIAMAIILDEYGGTSGLVTLEDLLEEIVGDISDEFDDAEEEIEVVKENEYIVDATTKIDDVNEMIGTHFESEDFDSIGGYVVGILGRFPLCGEEVEKEGTRFIIEEVGKNRVEKLRILTLTS